MTSKLTRERLQEIAEDGFLKHGESKELARMALAAMDSEPVILYRERNPYNGLTTGWQELTENEFSFIKENAGENAEFLTLYRHAQPAPVVPAVSDDIGEIRVGRLPTMNQDDYPGLGDWWVQLRIGEDSDEVLARVYGATPQEENNRAEALACRAAMLHAGNPPVIPDGYVMVPMRLTAENGSKGALSGEFSETKFVNCPECFGDEECETCDGSGKIEITVPVTWTTIKEIWAKGVEHFAAAPQSPGSEPATVPGKWIPVSERLPEDSGRYWCYVEEQNDLGKSHYQWNCSWNGDRWWVESEGGGIVTHWMPLPAAPQEVNRE